MELKDLRERIDVIDSEILKLLNQRTTCALKIGSIKKSMGLSSYVPNRENEIVSRVVKLNKGPFPDSGLAAVYRELMSATRFLEKPIKVAYMGPEATFSHLAALKKFGQSVHYFPVKTIRDVFEEVERKRVDYGVVPIENSIEGVINYTLDMFVESNLKIYGEILLDVSLNLFSNSSRFLVIKDSSCEKTGHDKTSIVFSVKDKVGTLHNILVPFAGYKINLTKIESRPSRKKAWDYIFFVDFQGHKDDEKVSLCLSEVNKRCNFLKILGSYPIGG